MTVRFGAPLASSGSLEYVAGVGFSALISHQPGPRGRYSFAHEIGHTFFADRMAEAKRGVLGVSDESLLSASSIVLEEHFCESFAAELLLPTEAAQSELHPLSLVEDTKDFLPIAEQVSARFSISLRTLLIRAFTVGLWPKGLLVAVLDASWQRRKVRADELEVVAAYSNRASGWYLPNRQTASAAGLLKGIQLARAWDELAKRTPKAIAAAGAFDLDEGAGTLQKLDSDRRARNRTTVSENVFLKRREADGGWSRHRLATEVVYRLYASSASEAYVLGVARLPPLTHQ